MKAKIVWFTGLSGSGKTTLSKKLQKILKEKKYKVLAIDGDKFRKKNKSENAFTKTNIVKNNIRIIRYINKIFKKYNFIIVSVISPFLKTRKIAKKKFNKNYFEVFVKCKISTLKRRDTKGLYKLADEKKIKNLIGYKSKIKYEKSNYNKVSIDTDNLNINSSIQKIIRNLI